jgi:hypothetical protein
MEGGKKKNYEILPVQLFSGTLTFWLKASYPCFVQHYWTGAGEGNERSCSLLDPWVWVSGSAFAAVIIGEV